jgi:EmrB/QacA subfamily drug resistance transporter
MKTSGRPGWTFILTSMALFMTALDNLVVTTALPVIQQRLHASLSDLEWTVNAYTLTFAVLLLTGAALGDRFGRKRLFLIGVAIFTLASAGAAMSTTAGQLVAARALQGVGGAILTPLTLTLLSAAVPPARRGLALGAWGAVGGLAVAVGPVVGGAIVDGASWEWIFWLNVPIGLAMIPLGLRYLTESTGPMGRLDLRGAALASASLFAIVLGLVRGHSWGWGSGPIIALFAVGAALLAVFLRLQVALLRRGEQPMVPLHLFRSRTFSAINIASLAMFFGVFGSVFLLAQFLQVVMGYSPFQAGLRTLPWTAMPAVVAPLAALWAERVGGRRVVALGLALQAIGLGWLAAVSSTSVSYPALVPGLAVAGVGMGLFFAPVANLVLSSVDRSQEGIASGVNNAIRELGGVFGVAVLASVFAHAGGYGSPSSFTAGLVPAVWVGASVVAVGALIALLARRPSSPNKIAPSGSSAVPASSVPASSVPSQAAIPSSI